MVGCLGFKGILSTQIATISHLKKFKVMLLVRPMACIKEIIHIG